MTLSPEGRVLLTDALRPPAGFRVDVAVGTTYSLNLTALLLAPLTFAMFERADSSEVDTADPVQLLEAVRRHAGHTTVFCQAGGIDIPAKFTNILTFVEDSVLEVTAPTEGAIFHPKVWAIRFVNEFGAQLHRAVVLSRNLTFDRSWDTALVLDEDPDGTIDAAPMGEFVLGLPPLAVRPVEDKRLADITSLAASLRTVKFSAPSPFTGGELLPIGLNNTRVWPFPDEARRMLAISPFLTKSAVSTLGTVAGEKTLLSRAESLDQLGSEAMEGWRTHVLQRLAEVEPGEDIGEATPALSEFQGTKEGLHAKTFVMDLAGSQSMVVTGSANLTSKTWGTNVEFDAVLRGPTRQCGVKKTLEGTPPEAPGLLGIIEEYVPDNSDESPDPSIATTRAIERFHQALALSEPVLDVARIDDDRVDTTLTLDYPNDALGSTRVWPVSLPGGSQAHSLEPALSWRISPDSVTPFIAVETTAGEGAGAATCRCVIKASLTGDIGDRRQNAMATVLKNRGDVLRYLVFLLGDPAYDALSAELAGVAGSGWDFDGARRGSSSNVALFEPLVRAAGHDDDAIARVASLVEDLRAMANGDELVPEGFDDLWDVVWQVHKERRS
jgi:hypothetical protein